MATQASPLWAIDYTKTHLAATSAPTPNQTASIKLASLVLNHPTDGLTMARIHTNQASMPTVSTLSKTNSVMLKTINALADVSQAMKPKMQPVRHQQVKELLTDAARLASDECFQTTYRVKLSLQPTAKAVKDWAIRYAELTTKALTSGKVTDHDKLETAKVVLFSGEAGLQRANVHLQVTVLTKLSVSDRVQYRALVGICDTAQALSDAKPDTTWTTMRHNLLTAARIIVVDFATTTPTTSGKE